MWEVAAVALAKGVLQRVGGDVTGKLIRGQQDRRAFERAVEAALGRAEADYRERLQDYDVNVGFFEHEGAAEIAKLLLPGPGPDPRNLANAYVRSLGVTRVSQQKQLSEALEIPFQTLLDYLVEELGRHERFRTWLHEVDSTRSDRPGKADERELLAWIADAFAYLQTAGIGTTEYVQLPLGEVFVPLSATLERTPGVRWRTREEEQRAVLEERLRSAEISAEEYEALLDRLAVEEQREAPADEPVAIMDAIRDHDRVLVLGDPGSGKTTLLRYLALRHARGLLQGLSRDAELGDFRVPVYVRAGNFARWADRQAGLRSFIPDYLTATLECPVERLNSLIEMELRAGRCVVLLDGLDEVTTAADRQQVVASIASFVSAYRARGNHFICTSRISGYAAAPLPPEFLAVRVLEMDDRGIEQFLRLYVPALERAEARGKSDEIIQRDSARAVSQLLRAFRETPGVRRLAANPLLLTALLLVHRTRGHLPERRVDAYKSVTDALGRTWRAVQGVPEAELPDERRLTQWLTRLADWLHANRPEGSATIRDLLGVLGPLWANLQRQSWDPALVDSSDPLETEAGRAILDFVEQVAHHSGLIVERAPRRWGFPHLTFEEFYTGRALVFEGRASGRASRIRNRLHDARYNEPILLGLGLVGRDYPEEVEVLFEAALLAEGPEAASLGLSPSPLEDLLGRDFLFALRALGDDIPASPDLVDVLLDRLLDQWLASSGPGRFTAYRSALRERISGLRTVTAGRRLAQLLVARVVNDQDIGQLASEWVELASELRMHPETREMLARIAEVAPEPTALAAITALSDNGSVSGTLQARLVDMVGSTETAFGSRAAQLLSQCHSLTEVVSSRLVELLGSDDPPIAIEAAQALGPRVEHAAAVIARVLVLLRSDNPETAYEAAELLFERTEFADEVSTRLVDLLGTDDPGVTYGAEGLLGRNRELVLSVSPRLVDLIADGRGMVLYRAAALLRGLGGLPDVVSVQLVDLVASDDDRVRYEAVQLLSELDELPHAATARLGELTASQDPNIAYEATRVLAARDECPELVSTRLGELLASEDPIVALQAAQMLSRRSELSESVSSRLRELLASEAASVAYQVAETLGTRGEDVDAVRARLGDLLASEDPNVAYQAAELLSQRGELLEAVHARLLELTGTADGTLGALAFELLSQRGEVPTVVIDQMIELLRDDNSWTSYRVAQSLAQGGALSDAVAGQLIAILGRFHSAPSRDGESALTELPETSASTLFGMSTAPEFWQARRAAINLLEGLPPSPLLIGALFERLGHDNDNDVRKAAAAGLVAFARDPDWREQVERRLLNALESPDFSERDTIEDRAAHDYAFDALWLTYGGGSD